MTFQDYFYTNGESTTTSTSYEEQLLLNYEDYLDGNFKTPLTANNHYMLELRDEYPEA
ncbi:hypothetical protein IRZ71_11645 [Flavobacterium sp. ANB]|uniref:hypothetical protein n=1 Tax=unclassified Flavobacterium TaxID=196869 RepID=UPI0012B761F1|nr:MULTISPECIES: hypothetical protein [unclassified Flavobacterium]MBF4517005.1 hypothetical protein [Flavobacterium sp. ANB]MTD69099.1 hypothetical protein [Flavobacterium sp. LC2016-13]